MDISGINSIAGLTKGIQSPEKTEETGSAFGQFYKSAIELLDETNTLQKEADQMSMDFALGKVDSIHDVMMAQEKASIALQYTVQLRDSLLDAYNEIMRMQV